MQEKSVTEAEYRIRVRETFEKGCLHERERANPKIRKIYSQDNKGNGANTPPKNP